MKKQSIMKNIGKRLLLLALAAVVLNACSDDMTSKDEMNGNQSSESKSGSSPYGNVPISFRVNNIVTAEVTSATTRAGSDALAEPALLNKQVGLFVLSESDYDRVLEGSAPISDYHYYNIPGTVCSGGAIEVTTPMFFPILRDAKIAVMAYYPYDENITGSLYQGITWLLQEDQSSNDNFYESDLLIGLPTGENPIEYASVNGVTTPISLNFVHKCSRVVVDVEMPNDETHECEYVEVSISDIPKEATINPWTGIVQTQNNLYPIKMFDDLYINGVVDNGKRKFTTTAIVLPRENNQPEISVTLKRANEEDNITYTRNDQIGRNYESGGTVRYSISITE